MVKRYEFTPEEFSYLWNLFGRINHFMHTSRTNDELEAFQFENYRMLAAFYHDVLVRKVSDETIARLSELDVGDLDLAGAIARDLPVFSD